MRLLHNMHVRTIPFVGLKNSIHIGLNLLFKLLYVSMIFFVKHTLHKTIGMDYFVSCNAWFINDYQIIPEYLYVLEYVYKNQAYTIQMFYL